MSKRDADRIIAGLFCNHPHKIMYRQHDGWDRFGCANCGKLVHMKRYA